MIPRNHWEIQKNVIYFQDFAENAKWISLDSVGGGEDPRGPLRPGPRKYQEIGSFSNPFTKYYLKHFKILSPDNALGFEALY